MRRGTHVLKALSVGAHACSGGRLYLYALAAAGAQGVARSLANLREEIVRGMKLMGRRNLAELGRDNRAGAEAGSAQADLLGPLIP